MDSRTVERVHPANFHIVEQLAPEEALVLVGLHELGKEDLSMRTLLSGNPRWRNSLRCSARLFCLARRVSRKCGWSISAA